MVFWRFALSANTFRGQWLWIVLALGCSAGGKPPEGKVKSAAAAEPAKPAAAEEPPKAARPEPQRRNPPPLLDEAPAEKATATSKESAPVIDVEALGMTFVLIKAGKFRRGATPEQHLKIREIWDNVEGPQIVDEFPARSIAITKPFEMLTKEVTQEQFEAVMGNNPAIKKGAGFPVNGVIPEQAIEFCRRLSKATGRPYRLPTEAEWEYCCRAGNDGIWCFGDDSELLDQYCWYSDNMGSGLHPTGTRKANAWGLFDMHGNVWELCSDKYSPTYYADSPDTDPAGPEDGKGNVVRGGSAFDDGWKTRCAERDFFPDRKVNIGFRVVREPEPASQ